MKQLQHNSIVKDEEKIREVKRLVNNREKEFLNFFNHNDHHNGLAKENHENIHENIVENKYIVLINPSTDDEELYNCFATLDAAKDAYRRINEENKAIATGNITYKMILGVIFVKKYEIEAFIDIKEV
ncbi:hypothetical protein [uncultured Clostridium sp.]|jgi:hypothetical protein|uniref:hypothetical protein n=1 Tax=uncultured Clostridium sp. TaxID=59620 RepID=UPI0026383E4C|nr:hypothetical protein [uncultured Clostridium sp.]